MDAPLHTDPLFQAVALALFDAGGVAREGSGPALDVWLDAGHLAILLHGASLDPGRFEAALPKLWEAQSGDAVDLVIVGGDRALFAMAGERRPAHSGQTALGVVRVAPDGSVEVDRASKRVVEPIRAALRGGVPPLRDRAFVTARITEIARKARAQADELATFQQQLAGRGARVTQALLAVIVALFATKWWIGAPGLSTDVRMGALVPQLTGTQPWRLVSHAFLHANVQHILFNGMTLWSLGTFFERLLGPWRFASLFALSAVGGGILATVAGPNAVMVGASGALWGMLGVSFALALRPGTTLPEALQAGFRRNAVTNLVLQVLVSLLPHVSWQAHLGGGLVGFALMLSGLLRPRDDGRGDRAWKVVGVASLAVSLVCVAVALATGKPWELREMPILGP